LNVIERARLENVSDDLPHSAVVNLIADIKGDFSEYAARRHSLQTLDTNICDGKCLN
jgi:hypothetical protein